MSEPSRRHSSAMILFLSRFVRHNTRIEILRHELHRRDRRAQLVRDAAHKIALHLAQPPLPRERPPQREKSSSRRQNRDNQQRTKPKCLLALLRIKPSRLREHAQDGKHSAPPLGKPLPHRRRSEQRVLPSVVQRDIRHNIPPHSPTPIPALSLPGAAGAKTVESKFLAVNREVTIEVKNGPSAALKSELRRDGTRAIRKNRKLNLRNKPADTETRRICKSGSSRFLAALRASGAGQDV